jgi:hypothetical protein
MGMKHNDGVSRRQLLFRTGVALVAAEIAAKTRSISKLLGGSSLLEGTAKAQGVGELKTLSLKKLREMDAKTEQSYRRKSWEDNDGCYSTAWVSGEQGNYVRITGGAYLKTLGKDLGIEFPRDIKNPAGEPLNVKIDLQQLYDYYVEACKANGCVTNDRVWLKIILNVHDNGVNVFAMFVDGKPKPGDNSDLKPGYPVIGLSYMKDKNGVGTTEHYFRVDNDTGASIAQNLHR